MEQNLANLRRKIALYREYLRDGVDAPLAHIYLEEIAAAEITLADLERAPKAKNGAGS